MTVMIIEGPDLSGKTTAINKISKHFNSGFVLKNSFKPKNKMDSSLIYSQYYGILNMIMDRKDLIILDRFFPSQAVYSYMRGSDEMEGGDIQALDILAEKMGILYIQLDVSLKHLESRYNKRGDEHIKITDLAILSERYNKFFDLTTMKKIKINTLDKDWFEKITRWINEHQRR